MIGPSKINNGGITFTLFAHTNREYGSTLAQDCGKPLSFLAKSEPYITKHYVYSFAKLGVKIN